jgi:drug/metabolite transporter (DMT)-like permease
VLQTLQMFIGEMGCWLVIGLFSIWQRYAGARAGYEAIPNNDGIATPASDESDVRDIANPLKPAHPDDEGRIPLEGTSVFLLALPAICDIAGTTLMNVGLLFVAASIYQMTRGALVLFVGLFSVWFLKRHLGLYKWFSLFVVVFGVAIVGLAGAITKDDKATPGHKSAHSDMVAMDVAPPLSQAVMTVIGVMLIAGAQIFTATQFVLEERIMEKYSMEPIKVVGWEGIFGFLVTFIGMIILHFSVGTGYFNAKEGLYQMTHNKGILISSFLIMISIGYVVSSSINDSANSVQWFQLLRSVSDSHCLRYITLHHRHVPHTLHLGCVARLGLGDFQVASGVGFCLPCVRNVLVQRLDQAAAQVVRGEEAGAFAARGPD